MTPGKPKRSQELQDAIDTINRHGGMLGASDAAARVGVPSANLRKYYVAPEWDIGCGGVYLRADVNAARKRRKAEGKA